MYHYRILEVLNVVDGDTIDCRLDLGFGLHANFRFRLFGVDAYETRGAERDQGLAAKAFTETWLGDRTNLFALTHKDGEVTIGIGDGAFGRWLAEIVDDRGVSLADELVAAGLADWS